MMIFKRILFYILSFTWGGILSFLGLLGIICLAPFKRVHVFHGRLYAVVGKNWGGLDMGCFFFCGNNCQDEHMLCHESGHGIQNIIWGPLGIFVIYIPSAIRYWYRELHYYRKGLEPKTAYDDIWFEGQATKWGYKYVLTDRI